MWPYGPLKTNVTKHIGSKRKIGDPVHNLCSFIMICDHLVGKTPHHYKEAFAIIICTWYRPKHRKIYIYCALFGTVTWWRSEHTGRESEGHSRNCCGYKICHTQWFTGWVNRSNRTKKIILAFFIPDLGLTFLHVVDCKA